MTEKTCGRPCACHPLQHLIAEVIARYEAPIPPPTLESVIQDLRYALEAWEILSA